MNDCGGRCRSAFRHVVCCLHLRFRVWIGGPHRFAAKPTLIPEHDETVAWRHRVGWTARALWSTSPRHCQRSGRGPASVEVLRSIRSLGVAPLTYHGILQNRAGIQSQSSVPGAGVGGSSVPQSTIAPTILSHVARVGGSTLTLAPSFTALHA